MLAGLFVVAGLLGGLAPLLAYRIGRSWGGRLFANNVRRDLISYYTVFAACAGIPLIMMVLGSLVVSGAGRAMFLGYGSPLLLLVVVGFSFIGLTLGVSFLALGRQLRSYRLNLCWKCGYCLIGNASGRCPECGTPVDPHTLEDPSIPVPPPEP